MLLGPLALAALTLRYLRRRRLLPHESAAALLCTAVIMAALGARRQPLPADLRRHACRLDPKAVHAAQLYLRCAYDAATLNSACGEALKLAGAWQWYDGVLFHSMLAAADAGGEPVGWAALLRGDADLHRLFELLRPVALAAEADELGGADESGDREAAALRAIPTPLRPRRASAAATRPARWSPARWSPAWGHGRAVSRASGRARRAALRSGPRSVMADRRAPHKREAE